MRAARCAVVDGRGTHRRRDEEEEEEESAEEGREEQEVDDVVLVFALGVEEGFVQVVEARQGQRSFDDFALQVHEDRVGHLLLQQEIATHAYKHE